MKLNKKLLIIIIAVVLIVIFAAVAVFIMLQKPSTSKPAPPTAAQLQSWQYAADKITTNLQGSSIIQLQVTLQANNSNVTQELTDRAVQVDDTIIGVLHNLSSNTILQPGGRTILKDQIMKDINSFLTSGKIISVYIQSLIIQ